MPEKILCIQPKQIGDVLMTTPVVRTLAQKMPSADVHFLTQSPSDQIFKYNPYVSKTIKIPAKPGFKKAIQILSALRKENYTIVLDFIGLPNTALISKLTGARKRIGFNLRGRSLFYTDAMNKPEGINYSASQKLHLLSAIGIEASDVKLDFFITEQERNYANALYEEIGVKENCPVITVSPVSRRDYKVWSAEKFALVCDHLVEKYAAQILFLWGPNEFHFVKKVRDLMKRSALPRYDVPSIAETVAILEKATLHIGNDNGPMHFAIAAGTPTIAVFGRPKKDNWIPPGSNRNIGIEFEPGCKSNCFYPNCKLECLEGVSADAVMEAADRILGNLL